MVGAEVLPFGGFVVEDLGVVDEDAFELAVELLARRTGGERRNLTRVLVATMNGP